MTPNKNRRVRSEGIMAETEPVRKEEPETHEETQNIANLRRLNSNRRSLRGTRAKSVVITEKERNLLLKQDDKMSSSPQPSRGFVKSMCRFYSDIIGDKRRTLLDRSVSFSAAKEKTSLESITEGEKGEVSSPISSRSGSFRLLNRSRSWRESRSSELSDTPKRNSPTGQSVRSQDSGFSDSGENIPSDLINASFEASPRETSPAEMPFVTKIEIEGNSPVEATTGSYLRTMKTPVARDCVVGSLGSIASIQEGLRNKLEMEARSLHVSGLPVVPPRISATMPREQRLLSPDTSADGAFSSSTPVRASFRRSRPQTMICLEDQMQPTPVKRESRTRLKEIKSRRRWSSMEHGNLATSPAPPHERLREASAVDSSPEFRIRSSIPQTELSPVTYRQQEQEYGESVCVDGTGTRLMLESFLEVNHADESGAHGVSTIFPSNSLLLAGIANDTIIEHEAKASDLSEANSLNSSKGQADPVIKWWMELFMSTEPECMTYLQSKPILKSKEPTPMPATPLAFYPYEMIKTTLVTKRAVLVTFSLLKR